MKQGSNEWCVKYDKRKVGGEKQKQEGNNRGGIQMIMEAKKRIRQ